VRNVPCGIPSLDIDLALARQPSRDGHLHGDDCGLQSGAVLLVHDVIRLDSGPPSAIHLPLAVYVEGQVCRRLRPQRGAVQGEGIPNFVMAAVQGLFLALLVALNVRPTPGKCWREEHTIAGNR